MNALRKRWVVLTVGLAALLAGCASNAPLDSLDPAGSKADDIDKLIMPIFIIAGIVFVLVQGAVLFMWRKFRVPTPKQGEEVFAGDYPDEEFPEQTHGHFALEIGWTVLPAVLLAIVGVFTVSVLLKLDDVEASDGQYGAMEVTVVGQQWWWEYQYHLDGDTTTPPDIVTANELVIPVGEEVRLYTTSRDVIHSFWIPRLNGKKDAVPGRVHPWVIQANEEGRFAGQCTEFCGLSHAYMRMYTVALNDADFDTWVQQQATPRTPLVSGDANFAGQELFVANCARCHSILGVTERDHDGDGTAEPDNLAMYGVLEDYRRLPTLDQGKYAGSSNLIAGAAPNLTHFASRSSFAGSFFELYPDAQDTVEAGGYLGLAGSPADRAAVEAWLRDPPGEKPAAPDQLRGMPNLNLSEADIDTLTDYLLSLD